ncbi:leucine-rich repeat-containing protein 37A3-like [Carlito syrichta]|uniref:Leucine-rich repeat-containing protein 37A3-like n=1 Tax=Carlito syrichta TaxID=1868482 RepID=A0A3Q0DX56_CARSF|nr:leucine-rich repeat-containing protein 37A3-like [Carlito syrichta]
MPTQGTLTTRTLCFLPDVGPTSGMDWNFRSVPSEPDQVAIPLQDLGLDRAADHQALGIKKKPFLDSQEFKSNKVYRFPEEPEERGLPRWWLEHHTNLHLNLKHIICRTIREGPSSASRVPLVPQESNVLLPNGNEAQHLNLPDVTVKPADVKLTTTKEAEPSPPWQEASAEVPVGAGPSSSEQELPAQPPESPGEVEHSVSQQEAPAQPPEASMERVTEASPNQEVTVPLSGEDEAHVYNTPNVTVKPVDVAITITSETTKEAEPSPAQ